MSGLYFKVTKAAKKNTIWYLAIVQTWSSTAFEILEIDFCNFKDSTLKNVYACRKLASKINSHPQAYRYSVAAES